MLLNAGKVLGSECFLRCLCSGVRGLRGASVGPPAPGGSPRSRRVLPGFCGAAVNLRKGRHQAVGRFPPLPVGTCRRQIQRPRWAKDARSGTRPSQLRPTVPLGAMALEGPQPTLPQPNRVDRHRPCPACWGECGTVLSWAHSQRVRLAHSPLAGH